MNGESACGSTCSPVAASQTVLDVNRPLPGD
jgi:hypothetical protein